ncbi:hypothetical protein N7507_010520 [Penicillium longicatenatum]|nr:hypothetical protein N7507_010520 [Penicillium longicatenatum]
MDQEIICDLVPQAEGTNFHLRNPPGHENRGIFANTQNDSSPLQTKLKIAEIHNGTMMADGKEWPATMLVLDLRFLSSKKEHRYKSASVTLTFKNKDPDQPNRPHVYEVAPEKIHLLARTESTRKQTFGASLGAQTGGGIATGDVGVYWEVVQEKSEYGNVRVTGRSHASSDQLYEDEVTWSMQENGQRRQGIPSFLQTAVLLRHTEHCDWTVSMRVESQVNSKSEALRFVKLRDDRDRFIEPMTFSTRTLPALNHKATSIPVDKLKQMDQIVLMEYFKANLSEEDPLTPPRLAELTERTERVEHVEKVELESKQSERHDVGTKAVTSLGNQSGESLGAEDGLREAVSAAFRAAKAAGTAAAAAVDASAAAVAAAEAALRVMGLTNKA